MTDLMPHATMNLTQRKARYGVVYLRALAGQVGCNFNETSPGEDVLAIDCNIEFPENIVRVQVKTTHTQAIDGSNPLITYHAEENWINKWAVSRVPVYFVVVVTPDDSSLWLDHHANGTDMVRTAAYWCRIDAAALRVSPTISVPRSQRVTADTLAVWYQDLLADYTPPAGK